MKTIIATLAQIVESAETTNDAAFSISEQFTELSVSASEGLAKDVNDYIEGTIDESKLSLYLIEAGIKPEVA